jgi:hypothetical protein
VGLVRALARRADDRGDINLGDGLTVRVSWKKANGVSTLQALKRAIKAVQAREAQDDAA